jgi:tetratricopeptide (TPR) repeat protein
MVLPDTHLCRKAACVVHDLLSLSALLCRRGCFEIDMQQQLGAAERQKAKGGELLGEGKLQPALFQYGLCKMNTRALAQQAMVAAEGGAGPSPAMLKEAAESGMPGGGGDDPMGGMLGGPQQQGGSADDAAAALRLYVAACNNSALVALRLGKFETVVENASEVLHVDSGNAKALYRRGVARTARGDLDGAREDLAAADAACPNDGGIATALADVLQRLKAAKDKQRSAMSKMFASDTASV